MPSVQSLPSCLQTLPEELLVKLVCNYLEVVDIVRLRQTNKFFHTFTRNQGLWRRMFAAAGPLPRVFPKPLPELYRFTDRSCAELLEYARDLDDAWYAPHPKFDEWVFDACFRVQEVLLLPGCRYLLATVSLHDERDLRGRQDAHAWGLVVYALVGRRGPLPLVFYRTSGLAYDLTAKFNNVQTRPKDQKPGAFTFAYITNNGWLVDKQGRGGLEEKDLEAEWLRDGLKSHHEKIATEWTAHQIGIVLENLEGLYIKAQEIVPGTPAFDRYLKILVRMDVRSCIVTPPSISERRPLSVPQLLHLTEGDPATMLLAVLCPPYVLVQQAWVKEPLSWTIEFNADAKMGDERSGATNIIRAVRFIPETKQIVIARQKSDGHLENSASAELHVCLYEIPSELYKTSDDIRVSGHIPVREVLGFHSKVSTCSDIHFATIDKNPVWKSRPGNLPERFEHLPALSVFLSSVPRSSGTGLKRWTVHACSPHLHVPEHNVSAYSSVRFYAPDMDEFGYGPRTSHAPGAVPMLAPHLCLDGMMSVFLGAQAEKEWRPVQSSTGAGRQLLYAAEAGKGEYASRVAGFYRLCEFVGGQSAVRRLPVSLPLYEGGVWDCSKLIVAWDDSMGRICWTFPGSRTIRVVDLVPLIKRDSWANSSVSSIVPAVVVGSPIRSNSESVELSPAVDSRWSRRISVLTELDFFLWDSTTPPRRY
ncbi:uncharacterized protein PHACADRAFT_28061 [Phanerochaete carnosa HHB-10118-sp]|uniref:F-box domain-containing protein n=1 Tax=Phanerochaete carnosa (strain HHB-10118-sp) TaxID=650164 RepID=K5VTX2_PHACS|nr:uncharacterized protein PHACADRAFT_28061 [Phanerochaete carnosa HHB-10118-sp]EKM54948.1 hypothetical protein PHACADRAFT_28061 [Phanerochaete carnosa HHB-10118-sp]